MFIDLWIVAHPLRLLHIFLPVLFGVVFAIFSYIYHLCGGINKYVDWISHEIYQLFKYKLFIGKASRIYIMWSIGASLKMPLSRLLESLFYPAAFMSCFLHSSSCDYSSIDVVVTPILYCLPVLNQMANLMDWMTNPVMEYSTRPRAFQWYWAISLAMRIRPICPPARSQIRANISIYLFNLDCSS